LTPIQLQPASQALAESLPRWEELPPDCQQELIQALAALLLRQPATQALLETRHEPEQ
jgi:hypothetical protein